MLRDIGVIRDVCEDAYMGKTVTNQSFEGRELECPSSPAPLAQRRCTLKTSFCWLILIKSDMEGFVAGSGHIQSIIMHSKRVYCLLWLLRRKVKTKCDNGGTAGNVCGIL